MDTQPLTLATFNAGQLEAAFSEALAVVVERFARAEGGEKLSCSYAVVTLKLRIEDARGGFSCSFEEPAVKLPKVVRQSTPAIADGGSLVVGTEPLPFQARLAT